MIPAPTPIDAPPRPGAEGDLDTLALTLAALAPAERDRLVAAEVTAAIRDHRIADAIRWQRVRLRARRLRERGGPDA